MPPPRRVAQLACFVLAVLCAACTSIDSQGSPVQVRATGRLGGVITVGSFDFPESVLLAYIYADALAANGFPVRVMADLGTRELVDPALMNGLIQIVPEYTGSALEFMTKGRHRGTSDEAATYASMAKLAKRRGLIAAEPAPAQDANAIVVTASTATRYHLHSITDLARVAPDLVFGGPPECRVRSDCLPGLRRIYGLHFKAFIPTDAGGPLTLQALDYGQIGAALLFTTDPSIAAHHLVILADSRAMQPTENITPLIRQETVVRYGPRLIATLDAVSARLSTMTLRILDARVELTGLAPRDVADGWLRQQGLIPRRLGVH
jgi:osmoprotectant transport system substrate-binding protein